MTHNLQERISSAVVSQLNGISSPLRECTIYGSIPQGKLLRSRLLINMAMMHSYNSDVNKLVAVGAAIEHGHLASLIHDDIIDGDMIRRGKPALHARFGVNAAIVSGDALLFTMFRNLAHLLPENICAEVIEDIAEMGLDLCQGEIEQFQLDSGNEYDLHKYLNICSRKTASYFSIMAKTGARIAGVNRTRVEEIKKFGLLFGIYYQIRDDLLKYISSDSAEGKPLDSDRRNNFITAEYFLSNKIDLRRSVLSHVYLSDDIPTFLAVRENGKDYENVSFPYLIQEMLSSFGRDLHKIITYLNPEGKEGEKGVRELISEVFSEE